MGGGCLARLHTRAGDGVCADIGVKMQFCSNLSQFEHLPVLVPSLPEHRIYLQSHQVLS